MSKDLYKEIILDHYKNPRNYGTPDKPSDYESYELENTSCGDRITLYINYDSETIIDIKYEIEGCAISTASTSLISEHLIGSDIDEIDEINADNIEDIINIQVTPMRMKCALLPRDAVKECIND